MAVQIWIRIYCGDAFCVGEKNDMCCYDVKQCFFLFVLLYSVVLVARKVSGVEIMISDIALLNKK